MPVTPANENRAVRLLRFGILAMVGLAGLLVIVLLGRLAVYSPWLPMRLVLPESDLVVVGQVVEHAAVHRIRVSEVLYGDLPGGERELTFRSRYNDDMDTSWQGLWWEGTWALAFLRDGVLGCEDAVPGSGIYPARGSATWEELQPTIEAARALVSTLALPDGKVRRSAEAEWLVTGIEDGLEDAYIDMLYSSPVARPYIFPPLLEHVAVRDVVGELDASQLDRLVAVLGDEGRWWEGDSSLVLILSELSNQRIDSLLGEQCRHYCAGETADRSWLYCNRLCQAVAVRLARYSDVPGVPALQSAWKASRSAPQSVNDDISELILGEGASLLR